MYDIKWKERLFFDSVCISSTSTHMMFVNVTDNFSSYESQNEILDC